MRTPPRWRVAADASFRWRQWDGEYVLYHDNSGDTHRLHAVGARVLELLGSRTMSAPDLLHQLVAENGGDADPELASELDQLLVRLHDLGLTDCLDDSRLVEPARTA